jgi:short subunit dehydrogenase-like uncharacterized protein
MDRDLDLVLLGATGFVGRLVAAHLAEHAPPGLRVALAGRSLPRLTALRDSLPDPAPAWPLLEVDLGDEEGVRAVAASTRVVATTAGPYADRGLPLVRACAAEGTSYADLTGEVLFVHRTVAECHETAAATGARIVHACGFDSVPSDLGVWLTADRARADGAGGLTDTVLRVRSARGGFSGGTIDSLRTQLRMEREDPTARAVARDPFALVGDRVVATRGGPVPAGSGPVRRRRRPLHRDGATGRWQAPFVMGAFNSAVVRRSAALLDPGYGPRFRYREVVDAGRGVRGAVRGAVSVAALGLVSAGLSHRASRAVLDRLLPAPGEGPSERAMREGRFRFEIEALTERGALYRTTVAADRDPGYGGTAVMFGQSALALAAGEGTGRAGVLTPATALGPALVERLRAHGFTLSTEQVRAPRG